jgi:serine/threonine protein kinase
MPFFCIHCRSEIDPKFRACPYCGEPITDFLRRYADTPIDGKYRIISRLGEGGMGEVYKVLHIHLNSIRVIKLMRANIAGDAGANDRFLREARMATKINHPNVATLFDFAALDEGAHYMVWEYIEGINLHELIEQRGPLSPRYAATLAVQALHGLDAIHRAGIVHRDVSPENLMVTRDDEGGERVKIIDLGIAKQWDETGDGSTKTGMFVGKWKYCSPEHLGMLEPGERIDGRADLYSFGIVLYEMLTGVPPFQADTPHAYLMLHSSGRPRPMRTVNPSVAESPELEALIFRVLEKDRAKRFRTAREFAQALEALLPSLSDAPGAEALPAAAEVTEERTRAARQPSKSLPGQSQFSTTLRGEGGEGAVPARASAVSAGIDRELAVMPAEEEPRAGSSKMLFIVMAIVVIAVLAGLLIMQRQSAAPLPAPLPVTRAAAPVALPSTSSATVVPAASAHLGINAFPWAEVTGIRNLDSGAQVQLAGPMVTPVPIDLPPGRYEVTVSNPDLNATMTRTVELHGGEEQRMTVTLADPEKAPLPHFGETP